LEISSHFNGVKYYIFFCRWEKPLKSFKVAPPYGIKRVLKIKIGKRRFSTLKVIDIGVKHGGYVKKDTLIPDFH